MSQWGMTSNADELMAELLSKVAGMPTATDELKQKVAQAIVARIPSNMHWKSGDGTLAGSFYASSRGVESDLPYARRREEGFSGRTDSLGRTYTNDPGAFYLKTTITQITDDVNSAFGEEMTALFG